MSTAAEHPGKSPDWIAGHKAGFQAGRIAAAEDIAIAVRAAWEIAGKELLACQSAPDIAVFLDRCIERSRAEPAPPVAEVIPTGSPAVAPAPVVDTSIQVTRRVRIRAGTREGTVIAIGSNLAHKPGYDIQVRWDRTDTMPEVTDIHTADQLELVPEVKP